MKRSWEVRDKGQTKEFRVTIYDIAPILKGLIRAKRMDARAEYMRKWHLEHMFDHLDEPMDEEE
jgi:hypothetical protein